MKSQLGDQKAQRPSGFTLIELLVVIAIIGILAAMLLPVLGRAKAKGQAICCLSNLKQLQAAWFMYVHDNNDALPLNSTIHTSPWQSGPGSWVLGDAQTDATSSNLQAGVLYRYLGSPGVYRCPADKSNVMGRVDLLRTRSYSLSCYLNGVDDAVDWSPSADPNDKGKYSQLLPLPTSRIFAFIDEQEQSLDDGVMIVRSDSYSYPNEWFDLPADRHSQGCNLSFTDGHTEPWHWKSPKKFKGHPTPEASPSDHEDVYRLRSCTPPGR